MNTLTITTRPAIITARMLSKSFGQGAGRVQVLTDLDISIAPGAMTLIKGPSGCGKSTLLAILAGLTPPDSGHVDMAGADLWGMPVRARDALRLARMGFIFQGSILFPALTAIQQVRFVLDQMGLPATGAETRARKALAAVGLSARADLLPAALSGGEKQRVAIACALAKRPQVIFADEPTSALDTENGQLVGALLRDLARDTGAAVVCVTHDDRLTPFAARILHMQDGRITGSTRHKDMM